jgi:hypothetical protein
MASGRGGTCPAIEVPTGGHRQASACCDNDHPSVVPDAFQAHILVKFVSLICRDATNNAKKLSVYFKVDK